MRSLLILCFLLCAASVGASASDNQQEQARDAYRKGEIMSLSDIRKNVRRSFNGEIIGTQFRPPTGAERRYIYKFKVMSPDGSVSTIDVDARTSGVIQVQEKR